MHWVFSFIPCVLGWRDDVRTLAITKDPDFMNIVARIKMLEEQMEETHKAA